MAANPRMLTADVTITWDGVQTHFARGTIVDIPAGGALEAAYGAGNLISLSSVPDTVSNDPGDVEPEQLEGGVG